jgi:CubicO group peptidase (beta-lactamase class C family)
MHPDWVVEPPAWHGFDPVRLAVLRAYAMDPEHHTNSVLIVRNGVLVAEWYADDRGPEDLVTSWSSAKSITATLLAIAVGEGLIPSLDEFASTYVSAWNGDERANISLRDLLHMASGLAWTETAALDADLTQLAYASDQLAYALAQTAAAPPGSLFNYSSGTSMVFSRVLQRATGISPEEYMREKLALPLGFSHWEWWRDGAGNTLTYCCINATPRDFAKIGQLYLQRGVWNGQQLLPVWWVEALWNDEAVNPSYALHFWRNRVGGDPHRPTLPPELLYAQGHDGQYLFLLPEQNLLVVRHARFVRPEGEPVAPDGLFNAGMFLRGLGDTGTRGPLPTWSVTRFLEMVLDALVDESH